MSAPLRLAVAAGSALLLAAGLAACTGSPDASESFDSKGKNPSASEPSEAPPQLDPLTAYLIPDDPNIDSDMQRQEEIIKKCMEEQGFEYTVIKPIPVDTDAFPSELTRDWIAEHGDGMIESQFLPNGERNLKGDGATNPSPNKPYYDSLPKAQQAAYDVALYGKDFETAENRKWEDSGCSGKAGHEVYPNLGKPDPPIIGDAEAFLASLDMNPKITAISEDVNRCLANEGQDPLDTRARFAHTSVASEFVEYLDKNPNATATDPEVIRLKKSEIARALAVWDCKAEADYDERRIAALTELEKDFIADHESELEEASIWLNG